MTYLITKDYEIYLGGWPGELVLIIRRTMTESLIGLSLHHQNMNRQLQLLI